MAGPIPGSNGGTGSQFVTFTGPTVARIYTLPDASVSIPNGADTPSLSGSYANPTWITSLAASKLTGNYVQTITGSVNQVLVNGTTGSAQIGAITLTLPQFIGTTSTPTFGAITLSSAGSGANFINNSAISGQSIAPVNFIGLDSGASQQFYGRIIGNIVDNTSGNEQGLLSLSVAELGSGTLTSYIEIDGSLVQVTLQKAVSALDHVAISTAGKTLKIKQGANACSGTGATMVGGVVTVSTTAVATGDIVLVSRTTAAGTLGLGMPTVTISNGVSFTLTSSNILETSTYSWVIIKAA